MIITTLFQYTIGVSIPLIILWIVYHTALASEKRLRTNRFLLLCIYLVSLLLFPLVSSLHSPVITQPESGFTTTINRIPGVISNVITPLSYVWLTGVTIMTIGTFIELIKVYTIIRRSDSVTFNGNTIRLTDDTRISPFSFWNTIIMNRTDFKDNADIIIKHETGHIRKCHTLDMIIAQFVTIICWYNPAAWLLRADLRSLHEFQADSFSLSNGLDPKTYQLFLIAKASSPKFPTFTNNLNHSKLAKRISMMNRPSPHFNMKSGLRYALLVLSLVIGSVTLIAKPVNAILSPIGYDKGSSPKTKSNLKLDVYIDGTLIPYDELNSIPSNSIKSITVNKERNKIDISTK